MTKGVASWGWSTVPQRHMGGKVFTYTQAKVIGGGSAINAQIYTRGNAQDYDEWRQMGCEGWSYDDVLPYFRKAEDNDTYDNEYHGKGGPLGVSQPAAPLPICEAYFEAARRWASRATWTSTARNRTASAYYQLTQRNARRSSAAMAYLAPNRGRANLTIKYGAQVRRIDVENGRATGVTLIDGTRLTADAEVILSSGAIGSPRLLQLSGIGPADHLQELGIDVVFDQPNVGENLQDHLDLYCICEVSGPHTYDRYAKLHWSALAGLQYLFTGRAPSPPASSRPAASGMPTPTRARPTSSSPRPRHGDRGGRRRDAAWRCDAELLLPAATLARDGAAGKCRPREGAADRPELLRRSARPGDVDPGPEADAAKSSHKNRSSPSSRPSACPGRT
jgi:choline dehydrogenase